MSEITEWASSASSKKEIESKKSAVSASSTEVENPTKYRSLVIDSGPIIRLSGLRQLHKLATHFYTVPAVVAEIRDAKARHHLEELPFELKTRIPTSQSESVVTEFARLTGDFQSLSSVDLQVLALLYELEQEGCGTVEHIRKTPKRTLGVGKVELLNSNAANNDSAKSEPKTHEAIQEEGEEEYVIEYDDDEVDIDEDDEEEKGDKDTVAFFEQAPDTGKATLIAVTKSFSPQSAPSAKPTSTSDSGPKSWAMLVNPAAASSLPTMSSDTAAIDVSEQLPFCQKKITTTTTAHEDGGQFSDAEDDDGIVASNNGKDGDTIPPDLVEELQKDFPSLAASLNVPYEGEDDEQNTNNNSSTTESGDTEEERKRQATQPISKSGKLYNSFRGYGKLFKPAHKPTTEKLKETEAEACVEKQAKVEKVETIAETESEFEVQSRIFGGNQMSGQEVDVEDDGEGWITCSRDIRSLQAAGTLAPLKNQSQGKENKGPPISQRTACATTDFAMQNVILQMNLELVSVDGVKIRRLKNWVTRCGACFKVYTKNDDAGPHGMKRLFCERCGSDMLQRIAASVDGKTGRLRLHMSKRHKNNLRGTKFSLPKPGTGNRFQGDLLLREDQLLMGAWNQKVKIRSGGKAKSAAQSMFGQDIAANVGCRARSMNVDDIAAGFGRRNPNSAKGRERRGKKKKSSEKACGLRRYH